MKLFNDKMYNLFKTIVFHNVHLHESLEKIISNGFSESEECYFILNLLDKSQSVSKSDFIDKSGYECFVNSVHIDDFIEDDFLQQAFLLIEKTFEVWSESNKSINLVGIISQTDFGANVKFYVQRPNETYINKDQIDAFEDAIMIAVSN